MRIVFGDNLGDSQAGGWTGCLCLASYQQNLWGQVHSYLAIKVFDHWEESFLSFRKKLAKSLINNPYYVRELRKTRRSRGQENELPSHEHQSAPVFVWHWTGELWDGTSSKTKYPQYDCKTPGCRNRVHTYCSCDRATWMCRTIRHVQEVACSTWSRHLIQYFRI